MSSLWLGEDHLVYVRGSGLLMPFSEEYKRYRYRDIQAVSVAKTSRVVGIVLFILGLISCAGLMALVLWQVGDEGVTALKAVSLSVLSFGALAFAAGLVSHLILGPTCVCDIQTSLSRDRLRPLSRYLRALQVVDRLKGLVRESQEELAGNRGGGRGSDGNSPAATAAVEAFQLPRSASINFGIFTGIGVILILALMLESIFLTGTTLALLMGCSLILSLSLIASMKRATPDSIRSMLWIQLGLLFLLTASGTIYYLLVAIQNPEYTIGITGPLEAFTAIAAEGGLLGYLTFAVLSAGFLVSGISGNVIATRWKAKIAQVEAGSDTVDSESVNG